MQQLKKYKRIALMLSVLTILAACGQKGDLYLPDGDSDNNLTQVN